MIWIPKLLSLLAGCCVGISYSSLDSCWIPELFKQQQCSLWSEFPNCWPAAVWVSFNSYSWVAEPFSVCASLSILQYINVLWSNWQCALQLGLSFNSYSWAVNRRYIREYWLVLAHRGEIRYQAVGPCRRSYHTGLQEHRYGRQASRLRLWARPTERGRTVKQLIPWHKLTWQR